MPISRKFELRRSTNDEFHQAAKAIVGIAFELQNERGRYLNEWNYQLALRSRIEARSLGDVICEGEITLTYQGFQKSLFIDLLFKSMMLAEIKAKSNLGAADEAQLLQYLAVLGLQDGLLLNLGSPKVQKRFVSTRLPIHERRRFYTNDSRWIPDSNAAVHLAGIANGLISDWGTGLQRSMYTEAMVHCLGGAETVNHDVAVYDGGTPIGHIKLNLVDAESGFVFMTAKPSTPGLENGLRKLLGSTRLSRLHWINLYHQQLDFVTLINEQNGTNG